MSEIRAEMERARADGQLQKALSLCRRLLELDPDDQALLRTAQAVEAEIREKEVEQLSSMALGYATDGDMDLAMKIADRIGRLAPGSPRYAQLRSYLGEEAARRKAETLTATAQEHLALGNLEEAHAAAEEALASVPDHPVAREIRDRAGKVLAVRRTPVPVPAPPAAPPETVALAAPPPPETVSFPAPPEQPAAPSVEEPREPVPPAAVAAPAEEVAEPAPAAAPEPVPAAAPEPPPAPVPAPADSPYETPTVRMPAPPTPVPAAAAPRTEEARRHAEAAALTSAALSAFMQSNHAKARKAVEKALALEPENKKAKELAKILSSLG